MVLAFEGDYSIGAKKEQMEKQYLKRLLDKFRDGTISEGERKQLDLWYDSFDDRGGYTQMLSEREKAAMERSLLNKIDAQIDAPARPEAKLRSAAIEFDRSYLPKWKVAAACSLIIFVAAFAYLSLFSSTVTHATGFGQTARITLPDESVVILNGNSTLSYKDAWGSRGVREVSLDGEAYFEVKRSDNHQRFLVHTSEGIQVEVLGTAFSVSNRPHSTRVVLNSGKVQLNIRDQEHGDKLTMAPGELVEFGNDPLHYTRRSVNPDVYSSWKDRKLVLERTSLMELLTMIEDTYGLTLKVVDKSLLNQRMSGKVPVENLDTLIQDISAIYKVEFKDY